MSSDAGVADSRTVTRTRTLARNRRDLTSFLADVADLIRSERVTGQIIIDVGQGQFSGARIVESMDLQPLP